MGGVKAIYLSSLLLFAGLSSEAVADSKPYAGTAELSVKGKTLVVSHVHHRGRGLAEWYSSKVQSLSECAQTARNQGILQVFHGSQRLFCTAVPALSRLWLSPDEKYVVGLSDIMHNNPYQVVVYSTEGRLLFRRAIDCRKEAIEGCGMSVTNWIGWFHETEPGISLEEGENGLLTLSLNSPANSRIQFVLPKYPSRELDLTPCGRNWQKLSAELYWILHTTNQAGVVGERGDVVCVWIEGRSYRDHYYVPRASFYDPTMKQQAWREIFGPTDPHPSESGKP